MQLQCPNLVKSLSERRRGRQVACSSDRTYAHPSTVIGDIPDEDHPSESPTSTVHHDPPMQIDTENASRFCDGICGPDSVMLDHNTDLHPSVCRVHLPSLSSNYIYSSTVNTIAWQSSVTELRSVGQSSVARRACVLIRCLCSMPPPCC